MLNRLEEAEAALGDLRAEIEAAATAEMDSDDEPSEGLLRQARFLKAFVDAGGELTKDETYEAARKAGYPDMRGIAGWFNGANATLRGTTAGTNELTGPGWEFWRDIRHLV